jgi:hydrogenase nickel incorporation protein HypA/HybF
VHELGITQEVLSAVLEAAGREGATRVNRVTVTVGELTEVVPDAMLFAWEALRRGTIAEEATLDIRVTPAKSRCTACDAVFSHDRFDRTCTACGDVMTSPVEGTELVIGEVDVDVPGQEGPDAPGDPDRAAAEAGGR